MHIFLGTRGPRHLVRDFFDQLSSQYLPYYHKLDAKGIHKKTNTRMKGSLRVRVCPVQLCDISFPEQYRDAMLTTLFGKGKGKTINKRHNKWAMLIRKVLGIEKIPDDYKTHQSLPTHPAHIEMIGIGIKEDYYKDCIEQI